MSKQNEMVRCHEKSVRAWRGAWQGSRQNDSPSGRYWGQRALDAFLSMSEEERVLLPQEMQEEYTGLEAEYRSPGFQPEDEISYA